MTRYKLNDATMWLLAAFVAILPLFLGGNRPLVWIGAFTVMSLLVAAYLALIVSINQELAFPLKRMRLYGVVFFIFTCFQAIQIVSGSMFHDGTFDGSSAPCCALSVAPRETVLAFMRWLTFGAVAFLGLQVSANRKRSERFMAILYWIVVFHGLIGFILFFMLNDAALLGRKWTYEGSMTGAFINRNTFATLLAAGLVLGVAHIVRMLRKRAEGTSANGGPNLLMGALIGASILVLVVDIAFTNSRMGLIVALVGVVSFIGLTVLGLRASGDGNAAVPEASRQVLSRLAVLAALGTLVLVILYFSPQLLDRVLLAEHSIADRTALFAKTWTMVEARPLTGFGGGSFAIAFPLFHQLPVNPHFIWDKAHNSYLALWSEYGLIFGSLPIILVGITFVALVANFRRDPLVAAAAAVVILSAIHALVDFSLEIEGYTVFFIAIVACGLARAVGSEQQPAGGVR